MAQACARWSEGLTLERPRAKAKVLSPATKTGSAAELAGIVREHDEALQAAALRLCRRPADARDLVQDTYLRALSIIDRHDPSRNTRAWLITILKNIYIDRFRQRSRREDAPGVHLVEVAELAAPEEAAPEPRWASITDEQFREAVSSLDEGFRAVFLLHTKEKKSYAEIALLLGIAKPTVGTRLMRARSKLAELLQPHLAREEAEL